MADALPLPPASTPFFDPRTGQVNILWQNYLNALEDALVINAAPIDAQYWVSTSNATLTNERNLGALSTGYLMLTTTLGIAVPSTITSLPAADLSGTIADARLSSNVPLKDGTNAFTGANSFTGTVTALAGAGASTVVPSGRVASITAAAPTTGTTEEILATYAMSANTLNADGQALRVSGGYTTAANGNNKTIRVRVGGIAGTIILTYTSATNNGAVWFDALLTRRTSTTAYGNGSATDGSTTTITGAAATPTLTGAVDIVVTGETGSASGDLTLQQAVFEYLG